MGYIIIIYEEREEERNQKIKFRNKPYQKNKKNGDRKGN